MGKKPKTKRWNRWEKDEEKLRKYKEQLQRKQQTQTQQEQIRHATENNPQIRHATESKPQKKLNRERIAKLVAEQLREDPNLKKLIEEIAQKVILRVLPEITELVISQMVKVIHEEVLKGAKVEIRGLATWKTKKGKIKVKNHIKPKQPNQP